jgi:hypothetical protein
MADLFALPRLYYDEGIRRYGFHGLSYEYIARVLPEVAPKIAEGRAIVGHFGSGVSMCAINTLDDASSIHPGGDRFQFFTGRLFYSQAISCHAVSGP